MTEEFKRFWGKYTYFHLCPVEVVPEIQTEGLRCDMSQGARRVIFLADTIQNCLSLVPALRDAMFIPPAYWARVSDADLKKLYKTIAIFAVNMKGKEFDMLPRACYMYEEYRPYACGDNPVETTRGRRYSSTEYTYAGDIERDRLTFCGTLQVVTHALKSQDSSGWAERPDDSISSERTVVVR